MRWTRSLCGLALAFGLFLAAGCGGGDDGDESGTSAKELSTQLISPNDLDVGDELHTDREFQWSDPIDFAVEGILIPESVPNTASKTAHAIEDAGFESGAGEVLINKDASVEVHLDVGKFDSDGGAAEARDYLNTIDLQQPCHGPCVVNPTKASALGIPNAKAVHQIPIKGEQLPPTAGPPFERRVLEFTIGPYLYVVDVGGPPGDVSEATWKKGVEAIYDNARKKTPAS